MYRCCNLKRFFFLLLCDAIIFSALMLLFRFSVWSSGFTENAQTAAVPVLMYHSIQSAFPNEHVLSPEDLESDLQYLKQHGYETVSAAELVAFVYEGKALPEQPVLLSFDDGFYNNYDTLLPLLEKYDFCAVVSVVGSFIETQTESDSHHTVYSYLTWEEISALSASGRVEIGNHTYNMHAYTGTRKGSARRSGESEEAYAECFRSDITKLQTLLQTQCGITPFVYAYPYGFISQESIPVLRELGFLITFSCYEYCNILTQGDPNCLYQLGRYNRPSGISTEAFMERALCPS